MDSTDEASLEQFTVAQLREELKLRILPRSGNKQELIKKIVQDNADKIQKGTMDVLKEERDRRQSHNLELMEMQQKLSKLQQDNSEEECEESPLPAPRHRPEGLDALTQSTRFSAHEIKLMYRGFKQECPSGVVDEDAFKHIFNQFFPLGDATQYAHYVFNSIKHKQSGKVNFEEFLSILSRVARGSLQEKLSWVFTLYDVDGDGRISRAEMLQVVQAIYELVGRAAAPPVGQGAARDHVDRIFHLMDTNADGAVTPDELARWVARDPAVLRSLDTLDTVL